MKTRPAGRLLALLFVCAITVLSVSGFALAAEGEVAGSIQYVNSYRRRACFVVPPVRRGIIFSSLI